MAFVVTELALVVDDYEELYLQSSHLSLTTMRSCSVSAAESRARGTESGRVASCVKSSSMSLVSLDGVSSGHAVMVGWHDVDVDVALRVV